MADQTNESAERVSALVDGQLEGDEFLQTLAELESSALARSNWDSYHLVGEVMRSGALEVRAHDADFLARLRQRMALEPTGISSIAGGSMVAKSPSKLSPVDSANDGSWRRVAGFASVVLASLLGWQGVQWANSGNTGAQAQLAQQSVAPSVSVATAVAPSQSMRPNERQTLLRPDGTSALTVVSEPQVMIRNPQLDALLAAHRLVGAASVLQMPAGFLRNTTLEEGPR